jgi:Domain of unknown function (DUF4157)
MRKSPLSQTPHTATPNSTTAPSGILQRKCASCGNHTIAGGKCEECKNKHGVLQRKLSKTSESSEVPPLVHEVLRSSGQPLQTATRAFMEPRFGYDFSGVRVHTDTKASESAQMVDALAYTVGRNIVFGAGQYVPNTQAGRGLLAHELTHVMQAGNSPAGSAIEIGQDDSIQERAAEHNETSAHPVGGHSAANLLQRKKGGSAGGFFANIGRAIADIFTDEPDYDQQTLKNYLKYLKDNQDIEDDFDSDNKARAVVETEMFKAEGTDIKTLLVKEMLSGTAFDADEQAILSIFEFVSANEREQIATTVTYARLYDKFHGEELDRLYGLLPNMDRFYPRGKEEYKTHTFEEYIKKWEAAHGRSLTDPERKVLARGCVGITSLNLGIIPNPNLSECYGSFEAAWNAAQKMNEFLAAGFPTKKAIIFSKRFWASGNDYTPDPKTGRVDMSKYDNRPRPGFTNFDYGFYDETTNKWWHANHCNPSILGPVECRLKRPTEAMEVYESNLQRYSRDLQDFDEQVFCVGVPTLT